MQLLRVVSQEEIARRLGLHPQTYGDYERGGEPVPRQTLLAMQQVLLEEGVADFAPAP